MPKDELSILRDEYRLSAGKKAADIRVAAEAGDAEQFCMLVHRLKGSAGTYGFHALGQAASDSERLAKLPGTHLKVAAVAVLRELERLGGPPSEQ